MKKAPNLARRDRRILLKAGVRHAAPVEPGTQLIYRRPVAGAGVWSARRRDVASGSIALQRIGIADDADPADGRVVFSYEQAVAAARLPAAPVAAGSFTVKRATEHYLRWFTAHRKGLGTVSSAINVHILPAFGNRTVASLTAPELREFLDTLATKAPTRRTSRVTGKARTVVPPTTEEAKRQRRATANRIYSVFRAVLNRAFADELVASDAAWRKVKPHRAADAPKIRFLTTAECTRLVNVTSGDFRALVRGALACGARYGELAKLKVRDFDASTGLLYIAPGKSTHDRHIPLNAEGVALFKAQTTGRKPDAILFPNGDREWHPGEQRRPLLAACAVAQITPAIGFHVLRHSYASALARARIDLLTISKLLGHADTRVTSRHYAHLCDETLAAAAAVLPRVVDDDQTNVTAIA